MMNKCKYILTQELLQELEEKRGKNGLTQNEYYGQVFSNMYWWIIKKRRTCGKKYYDKLIKLLQK